MFALKNRYMEGEGDGNGGSSGGNNTDALVKAAVEEATSAMNRKNAELLQELKDAKASVKQFEGLDLEKLTALQKHMDESEEAKLIAEGKIDEVFSKRFSRVREDYESKLGAANKKSEENEKSFNHYKGLYTKEKIRNSAIRSAEKAGVMPEAIDDVVDKVMSKFALDENGDLEARDESGSLIMSKDGKNVLKPDEYISETVKEKYPYYWPTSRSGGLGGASGGIGGGGASGADEKAMLGAAKSKNMAEFRQLRKSQKQ